MTLRPLGRATAAVAVVALTILGPAAPAGADPAGPTDYRSEVVGLEPETSAVEVRFIGGDAFLEIDVERGHEVEVKGYDGEPYVRVGADGTVSEDRNTATWVLSQDRYGAGEVPDDGAGPDWTEVATGGRYAWHDHRAHWMGRERPLGADPGDQILEAVIPLTVDGEDVDITVASYLEHPPSVWSWLVVAAAAIGSVAAGLVAVRRDALTALAGVASALALLVGVVALRSVPAVTGPSPSLWVPAGLAVGSVLVAAVIARRQSQTADLVVRALVGLAGVELAVWGVIRREVLVRAILPTALPATLDRMVVVIAVVTGLIVAGASLVRLVAVAVVPAITDDA